MECGSVGGGGEDLLAELLVVLQAVERLLGRALVGFLLAVALGIAGEDAAQQYCRAEDGVLVCVGIGVNEFKLDEIKTAKAAEILKALKVGKKTLIVLPEKDETIYKSARNIAGVKVATVNTISTYDILNANTLLVTEAGVKKIEEVYA